MPAELRSDQAAGLRRIARPHPVRVIVVTGGKGGVGKTSVSVNLAVALAQLNKEVLLMDADLGLSNVDVLLGLRPLYNLSHVLSGERSLEEIIIDGPAGVRIVPAASGVAGMADLNHLHHAGIIRAFSALGQSLDVLIIDTAAGVSDSVLSFSRAAQEIIVVVCDEPASITDAYALIKLLTREHGHRTFRVLANMTRGPQEGIALFAKLTRATNRFLDVTLDYLGAVPYDDYMRKAIRQQKSVMEAFPGSKASGAFKGLAHAIDAWPVRRHAEGQLEFFVERLLQIQQADTDDDSAPEGIAKVAL